MYLDRSSGQDQTGVVPLIELFPTPLHHASLNDIYVDISNSPKIGFVRATKRWPIENPYNDGIVIYDRANVVLNTEGAICDWFSQSRIQPTKREGQDISKINVCSLSKHRRKHNKKTKPLWMASIRKAKARLDNFDGVQLPNDTLNVLCIITNRPVSIDVTVDALPEDTLVIHQEVYEAYFGRDYVYSNKITI